MATQQPYSLVDMATRSLPKVEYDGRLMLEDAAAKSLDAKKLAALTKGKDRLSLRTVYRFLSGNVQTANTARVLAAVIGRPVARYIIRSRSEAVAS